MKKIDVSISWSGKNYAALASGEIINGSVLITNKSLFDLKNEFKESLEFHFEAAIQDGDTFPDWILKKEYELNFILETSALLRYATKYTSLAAISRASKINQRQLSHYANARSVPREPQRQRIVEGLHEIGKEFLSFV